MFMRVDIASAYPLIECLTHHVHLPAECFVYKATMSLHLYLLFVGTDILGNPMIVEPSHQQRLSSR